jgi:hypothetical protein
VGTRQARFRGAEKERAEQQRIVEAYSASLATIATITELEIEEKSLEKQIEELTRSVTTLICI